MSGRMSEEADDERAGRRATAIGDVFLEATGVRYELVDTLCVLHVFSASTRASGRRRRGNGDAVRSGRGLGQVGGDRDRTRVDSALLQGNHTPEEHVWPDLTCAQTRGARPANLGRLRAGEVAITSTGGDAGTGRTTGICGGRRRRTAS